MSTSAVTASSPERQQQQGQLPSSTPSQQPPGPQKSNFNDWVVDGDDDFFYQDNRARGGRKKRKKNNKTQERTWDWDDIYDPTLPNNYADYKHSEEQHREIREWKARLYHHQMKEAKRAERNVGRDGVAKEAEKQARPNMMFAPPASLQFAPPSFEDAPVAPRSGDDDDDDYYPLPVNGQQSDRSFAPPPSFAPASAADDANADDVYMRRMQMSGMAAVQSNAGNVEQQAATSMIPPAPENTDAELAAKRAEAQAKIAAFKAKLLQKQKQKTVQEPETDTVAPPPPPPPEDEISQIQPNQIQHPPNVPEAASPALQSTSTIARAPVRYEVPPPPPPTGNDDVEMADADSGQSPATTDDQPRSIRPGQKGFAERLLKKFGWEKGRGLGAQGDGITTAIIAKAEKRKKRSDAQGGGWAVPANMGKIVGGKKRKAEPSADGSGADSGGEDPRFGAMSSVIKLSSMLDGLDVQHEIEENNIMQEIGDEMGGQYGNVERVYIWREEMGGNNEVFVKFTSQLSGLRAVNAMNGIEFAGNEVKAQFWDEEKWGKGEYA